MTKITTVIANHNYERFIKQAITSCQTQTTPTKIVVVDDCSTDKSWQTIYDTLNFTNPKVQETNYGTAVTDSNNIAVRLNKSLGPSYARNIGISLTIQDTDFYQILDADDYMYNHKIQTLLRKIVEHPDIAVVYADYDIYNVENKTLIREYKKPYSFDLLLKECIVHSGAMIRASVLKEVVENTGFYDVNLRCAEDYDLWIRIAERYQIAHLPEALAFVRVHNANSTNSVPSQIWQACMQRVSQKFQQRQNATQQ